MTQSSDENEGRDNAKDEAESERATRGSQRRGSAPRKATRRTTSSSTDEKSSSRPAKKAAAPASSRRGAVQVARQVAGQLEELTGKAPESVTAVESTGDGWVLHYEVVESRRVPDSADILALYEARADDRGDLAGYRRLRRYPRGYTGDDPSGDRG